MSEIKMVFQNQKLERDPSLKQIPIGSYVSVADGVNLRGNIIQDIGGFSLRPSYSAKQLRRIERIAKRNPDCRKRYSIFLQCNNKDFPERRLIKPSVGDLLTTGQTEAEFDGYKLTHLQSGDLE